MAIPKDVKIGERIPLSRDEWNNILDKFLPYRILEIEDYERTNDMQKYVLSEIRKSWRRTDK